MRVLRPGQDKPFPTPTLTPALAQAAIALIALCGLLFGDPGYILRSPETCYPIPREVNPTRSMDIPARPPPLALTRDTA